MFHHILKVQQLFRAVSRCGQSDDYHPALSSNERLSGCSEVQIYTDWANHYLAKSGCQRLIKDLSQDVTDGVLLAQIIQIIANEKVEDINGSPRSQSQMPHDPPPAPTTEGLASTGNCSLRKLIVWAQREENI
ncbi:hypothetical protein NQZ68_026919 [Dissostichus eleginoides]|nr:hypothetical protein NQZ68_026919 [Dissostichus eleginoides]